MKSNIRNKPLNFTNFIIIERENGINDMLESGTIIDARVSCELIRAIFMPSSPIHDGALVVQQGRLAMAGCFLPLSRGIDLTKDLGTRHRAAIGLTDLSDAVAIIVSEETGNVSVAVNGGITRNLDATSLKKVLGRLLEPRNTKIRKKAQKKKG